MIFSLFSEISVVLVLASALAIVAMFFRQSGILAYILTGIIIGPLGYLAFDSRETLEVMSKIGITLLLFMVGLEMNLSGLKQIGKSAVIIGLGQVIFTAIIGYFLSIAIGFSSMVSLYIALALTFSSTIIVVKLLSEKKDMGSLYGKILIGVLFVQDFIALFALMFLAGIGAKGDVLNFTPILIVFAKGIILSVVLIIIGKKILPKLIGFIARSQELLFLTSIAFALGIASFVSSSFIGLSLEIGGFLAGIALSYSSEHYQIHSRIRPVRDLFIVVFFITLGSTLVLGESLAGIWIPVLAFSGFILVGNPLIVLVIMGILGYKKRTAFFVGLGMAQISEFSFVLMQLGKNVSHIDERSVTIITLVGIITITISSYMILGGNWLYKYLSVFLKIFERKITIERPLAHKDMADHFVLIGSHRLGGHLLSVLPADKTEIIDFNPDTAKKLEIKGYNVIYGDMSDEEIQDDANMLKAKLIISTVPDLNDNISILTRIKEEKLKKPPKVMMTANEEWEAKILYEEGADYVILPHFIGAQQIAYMIAEDHDLPRLREYRERDLATLG
ncbi:hypothetical protein A2907_00070 [Candidatus Azambacteria bacterium RIFCSPLOWO2_01_FULL_37_9]|uniref:Uncharacterized protein n=1 Tax=Candidatus Azambacteria bacterium RIFCSPLOWO2_01_FULL_37_9 TaxID=1797297 RepID=A0A1F5C8U9_9BACT|nr:MAG: hypothetical protein A2907_00070 [Candidatus Azambacteria bacterium RIFCSPLOWO2_01_FULL_37_9]